jgi:LPXTG-motif cell wall-anchored protein
VYQRRYDELSRVFGFGGLLPVALVGLAALYFFRRK